MNPPIVYQPSVVSDDDSTRRFMLLVIDVWSKTKSKKPSLADMDEIAVNAYAAADEWRNLQRESAALSAVSELRSSAARI